MKYEITNPHDEAFIEADRHLIAAVAVIFFGRGQYGLQEVDGDFEMPLFLFGGMDDWFKQKFGLYFEQLVPAVDMEKIKEALRSLHYADERSSLTDMAEMAQKTAERL